jgi:hypothetical protein
VLRTSVFPSRSIKRIWKYLTNQVRMVPNGANVGGWDEHESFHAGGCEILGGRQSALDGGVYVLKTSTGKIVTLVG